MSDRETILEDAKYDRWLESQPSREECPQSASGRHSIDPCTLAFDSRNGLYVECFHCGVGAYIGVEVLTDCVRDAVEWPNDG